jgi:hypothetical protein
VNEISDTDLANFADEALSPEEMVRIEMALRTSASLRKRLDGIRQARDRGWHSVGATWRGHRLSCPTRSQLGSYLLDALDPQWQDYIQFHTEIVGCRMCVANLADLRALQVEQAPATVRRRQRVFKSSAGHLKRRKE